MASRVHRVLAGATALLALAGLVVIATDDSSFACERVHDRLAEILPRSSGTTQRWEDIYTLQEHTPEGMLLQGVSEQLGCRPIRSSATPHEGSTTTTTAAPTTTTAAAPPPSDPRLPRATDLGPTFVDEVSRGPIEGPGDVTSCTFEIPAAPAPAPVQRVSAWYLSEAALQQVAIEIVDYADEQQARSAFASVATTAACSQAGNHQDGDPTDLDVAGADQALSIGFTDPNDTVAIAAASVGRSIVVVHLDVHFGVSSIDFVPSDDLLALAVGRVAGAGADRPTTSLPPAGEPGSLESASVAIRAACRRFYDDDPDNFERKLTDAELAQQCDVPPITWRDDCYADRPAEFTPGVGGCAYLGGYLAVSYSETSPPGDHVFQVGNDTWAITPESD